ncbi:hypothetical protein SESBI_01094 [Sesbania bispinosa]|nr:hypothetical protein SESBI_01094 [Sesbania bispinosa]
MERPSAGGGADKFRHVVKGSHGIRGTGLYDLVSMVINLYCSLTAAIHGLSEHYGPLVGKTIEYTHAGGFKFLLNMMDDGMGENRHELPREVEKGSGRRGVVIDVSSDSSDNEVEGDGVEAIQGGGHVEVDIGVEGESGDNYVGGGVRGRSRRYRFEKTITRAQFTRKTVTGESFILT